MQTGTKERILVAAQKELLDWGRAGLRIDRVAGKAAINKRMIYHHFGDRQGLIEAALNQYAQTLLSASLSRPLKGLLQVLYPQVHPLSENSLRHDATEPLEGASDTAAERPVLEEAMRVIATDIIMREGLQRCKYSLTSMDQRSVAEEILDLVMPGVFQRRRKPVYRIRSTSQRG